jgi:hypothetical protein
MMYISKRHTTDAVECGEKLRPRAQFCSKRLWLAVDVHVWMALLRTSRMRMRLGAQFDWNGHQPAVSVIKVFETASGAN